MSCNGTTKSHASPCPDGSAGTIVPLSADPSGAFPGNTDESCEENRVLDRKHLFIVNPLAGKEDVSPRLIPRIVRDMKELGADYAIETVRYPGHVADILRNKTDDKALWSVYICGGDGTMNSALSGACGRDNLAVTNIPVGSGNDFIKLFGTEAARFQTLRSFVDGDIVPLDLICLGDKLALNIASVGFDARVAAGVERYKKWRWLSARNAYNMSVLKNFFHGLHERYEVTVDGVRHDGRFCMLVACNGRFYGGGFHPAPKALPDDGLLDFVLVRAVSRVKFLRCVGKYARGCIEALRDVVLPIRGRCMDIASAGPFVVNFDGECETRTQVRLSIHTERVNYIVPHGVRWTREHTAQPELLRVGANR